MKLYVILAPVAVARLHQIQVSIVCSEEVRSGKRVAAFSPLANSTPTISPEADGPPAKNPQPESLSIRFTKFPPLLHSK